MKDPLSLSSLFANFGNDLAAVDDKKGLLRLIAASLEPKLTISDILLSILNDDKQTHSVIIHHCDAAIMDKSDHSSLAKEKFRLDDGICNITLASPSTLVVDIASILLRPDPPLYIANWYRPSISRMIAVRLRSHGQLLGSLFLFVEKAHIGIEDLEMVQHFSYMIGPAFRNILSEEKISKQLKDSQTLLSIGSALEKIKNKEELFLLLEQRLHELFEFEYSRIILLHQDHPASGVEGSTYADVIEATLGSQDPLVFDLDKQQAGPLPDYIRQGYDNGIKEVVMSALRKEGEGFGVLILFAKTKGSLAQWQLETIRIVSSQLSIAFKNILTHEAAVEKDQDKSLIIALGKSLTSTRNRGDLIGVVEGSFRTILPFDELTISRLNTDGQTHCPYLHLHSEALKKHPDYVTMNGQDFSINDGIFDVVLHSDSPLYYDMDELMSTSSRAPYVRFFHSNGMRGMLVIPIRENSHCIGGVFIYFRKGSSLPQRTFNLLPGLCDQLSIGVANLWAFEKMENHKEENLRDKLRLEEENLYLQEQIRKEYSIKEIIGSSNAVRKLVELVSIVAPSDSTVLITGEAGTGKELIAKAIHLASSRKDKFMIKVDCAALTPNLLERELFGNENENYEGPMENRGGKFGLAIESTLFLDEIDRVPFEWQARLLRSIEEKDNVRVIAASNRDLRKEVEEGRFRSDLFYRLNVFPIHLPPLRERKEDLPMLASYFVEELTRRSGRKITNISHRALETLMGYDWPGNIRELEQILERSILTTNGPTIKEISLPVTREAGVVHPASDAPLKTLDELERDHILAILEKCQYKVGGPGGAAELLQLPATTLHSKIKKMGIRKE
jgi:transcriptional regulator with GAF, ATPase, and Fis domain